MIPDIALAASAREWPDRVHRFLLDHGGGRIVDRVMSPDRAVSGGYDVLLIDDVCSFLTPRLVGILKQSGVEVVGVYAPEDGPDAKRRLLECGISDVIETEAGPEEFLEKVRLTIAHRIPVTSQPTEASDSLSIGITGPTAGVGVTEVSIALAQAMAGHLSTVLVDLDQRWPSVAQRLDLPVHPNIRTALDHTLHHMDRLHEAIQVLGELLVVGGRADGGSAASISRPEAVMLIDALGNLGRVVVADLGPLGDIEGGLIREFDTLILVGTSDPVGVARLMRTTHAAQGAVADRSLLVVLNKVSRGTFHRSEAVRELTHAFDGLPVVTLPYDQRLVQAAWDGKTGSGREYRRAVGSMADVVIRSLS